MELASKSAANAGATLASAALLADISHVLLTYPILSFIALGLVGGLAGFFLLQETGATDALSRRAALCVLVRRLVLGAAIGVCVYVGWADESSQQGLWLLATGAIATSPVETVRRAIGVFQQLITRRHGP